MINSFDPIADENSEILILGSIPSLKSLEKFQYYGHPQNAFWWIMGELLGFDYKIDYELRKSQLIKNKIALWDVLKECERKGSLDAAIVSKTIQINDFLTFLKKHTSIKKILFNGKKAKIEFKKRIPSEIYTLYPHITYISLPSTSPAMALLNKSAKLAKWRVNIK